jgi:hypothetical protein
MESRKGWTIFSFLKISWERWIDPGGVLAMMVAGGLDHWPIFLQLELSNGNKCLPRRTLIG